MQSERILLVKNMVLSNSGINTLRHSTDKKKKGQVIGGFIGLFFVYVLLLAYCVLMSIGYGKMGLTSAIPVMCAVMISAVELIFTLIKTNGYLFAFKEYDMLMSLPFKVKTVVSSKFIYMYIKNLPMTISVSISMLIGYGIYAGPGILTYIIWIALSFMIPVIPMVIAAALGSLIAAIGSGFRHKNIIQTVLTFVFIIACIGSRFVIEKIAREGKIDETINTIADTADKIKEVFLPVQWFEKAICEKSIADILLLTGVSLLLFEGFFLIISHSYKRINSRLMSGVSRKKYKMEKLAIRSIPNSIAFKEFRRMVGSTVYMTNMCVGYILVVICCIATLFFDMNKILSDITEGAPVTKEMIIPAIPFLIYFLVGMVSTTSCSYSVEGKNFWIIKSLPIDMKTLLRGKMRFNMYLATPFMVLGNTWIGIACGASIGMLIVTNICGIALCWYSTTLGMLCNIKHPKLEWDNEIEAIKQGASVAIYMLPNMFITMFVVVGVVALGLFINSYLVLAIMTLIIIALSCLWMLGINNWCKRN